MTRRVTCAGLTGGHGRTTAFRDVDLEVDAGRILALLGPNGAGKTSLLLTMAGLLPAKGGTITVDGTRLATGRPSVANQAGLVLVPDDRSLFTGLSVEENLRVASRRHGPAPREMFGLFPALGKRSSLRAGALSGGEQQMLAMARALIQQPKVLLVDELSLGLAPQVVEHLFEAIRGIATDHSCAVLLVEQHVNLALAVADDAAVLNRGTIVLRSAASTLRNQSERLEQAYLGMVATPGPAPVQSASPPCQS